MADELIRILDPETAKAAQEIAKLGSNMLDKAEAAGKALAGVSNNIPTNAIGLLGDWLFHGRLRNLDRLQRRTAEILKERDVTEARDAGASVTVPILEAGMEADSDELRELWAQLLATALDPNRPGRVRKAFIETLKKMEALDAIVLRTSHSVDIRKRGTAASDSEFENAITRETGISDDEFVVSTSHLRDLGCLNGVRPTQYARLLLAALE